MRQEFVGLDRAGAQEALARLGQPRWRGDQVWRWVYGRGARAFSDMTNVPRALRAELAAEFAIFRPEVVERLDSRDGTIKWLLRFADGSAAESVYIPEADRGTLCVSSQVGCTLNCRFCHTGTQRLVRNLAPHEILGQVMLARDALGDWAAASDARRITNIVMMGMGEPLYNFESVAAALLIVMDGDGIAISKRRITLSTAGVVPMMARCGETLGVNLAVSLHAVTDALRDEIVPLNRKYPLAMLIAACRAYPGARNARRITFEYVMLDGVNDSDADARALVRLIAGIPAKVNLIPFNPWPGAPFSRSSVERMRGFAEIIRRAGYATPVRTPRGEDIMAACGQLKSATVRARRGRPTASPAG